MQAAGEEYLFRGLVLQALGSTRLPTWVCCVVSAALFATAHGQFDPPLFADRFVLGVVFAFLVVKTGGLEASIAVHTVKNIAGLIPAALLDDVSETLDPEGGITWLPVTVDVVLLAILVPWMLRSAGRAYAAERSPRRTPGNPSEPADAWQLSGRGRIQDAFWSRRTRSGIVSPRHSNGAPARCSDAVLQPWGMG